MGIALEYVIQEDYCRVQNLSRTWTVAQNAEDRGFANDINAIDFTHQYSYKSRISMSVMLLQVSDSLAPSPD